jgi:hypothetical protein
MKTVTSLLLIIILSASIFAQGNEFKVRYNGGTTATKVKPDNWGNRMTVAPTAIVLTLKDGQVVTIDPKRVSGLSYGKNASRNIKGYAAAAIIINPLFALGMFKKNKQHFIGITYETESGEKGTVLVQAKNDKYRSLLESLKGVTGKDVDMEETEKK